jgi:hypothetical protein
MEGYEVVTIDDKKVGTVAEASGEFLIVEHGMLRKSKNALPRQFAHVDDGEEQVRITVSKELFLNSPDFDEDEPDVQAVRDYYGLAPSEGPGTEGYGVTTPGDPARSAEEQGLRAGVEPAESERARMREERPEIEESPAMLGDRTAGVEERGREDR